jgi:hypothetical protein
MGSTFEVDFDATPPELPEGEYAVLVENVEIVKKDQKEPYLMMDLVIASDGEYMNRRIRKHRISYGENSAWKAAMFVQALGLSGTGKCQVSTDDLNGRMCRVRGATRPWKGTDGIIRKQFEADVYMSHDARQIAKQDAPDPVKQAVVPTKPANKTVKV